MAEKYMKVGDFIDQLGKHPDVYETIENTPEADVVEVVRCKDCEYFTPDALLDRTDYPNEIEADGLCDNTDKYTDETDFCSCGRRRLVRCEKCKYGDVSVFAKTKDGQEDIACYCTLKKVVTNIDSYCPSGRRRGT